MGSTEDHSEAWLKAHVTPVEDQTPGERYWSARSWRWFRSANIVDLMRERRRRREVIPPKKGAA